MKAFVIFATLLLVACAPAAIEDQTTTDTIVPTPAAPTAPSPPVVIDDNGIRDTFANLPSDVRTLLELVPEKTADGLSYTYTVYEGARLSALPASQSKVYQKGDTLKLELATQATRYDKATIINVVIVDRAAATARGFCTQSVSTCGQIPDERTATYKDYNIPTPLDWLVGLKDAKSLGNGENVDNRMTIKVSGVKDDVPVVLLLDRFSGVPVQATVGETVTTYGKLALGVKDSELLPVSS